jgi:hypothetical protein
LYQKFQNHNPRPLPHMVLAAQPSVSVSLVTDRICYPGAPLRGIATFKNIVGKPNWEAGGNVKFSLQMEGKVGSRRKCQVLAADGGEGEDNVKLSLQMEGKVGTMDRLSVK